MCHYLVGRSPFEMRGCIEVPGSASNSQHNQIGFKFHSGFENSLRNEVVSMGQRNTPFKYKDVMRVAEGAADHVGHRVL